MSLVVLVIIGCWRTPLFSATTTQNAKKQSSDASYYTGAFKGFGAGAGIGLLGADSFDNPTGINLEIFGRISGPMHLLDIRASYFFMYANPRYRGTDVSINSHQLSLSAQLHPFFLIMLQNNYLAYILGGCYARLGLGMLISTITADGYGDGNTEVDPTLLFGAGIDIPLGDPNDGNLFWLELAYHYDIADVETAIPGFTNLDQHVMTLAISYRINGL